MAVPKRKKSKSKQRMRRSQLKIGSPSLRPCPRCGAYVASHRVCSECGYYKGDTVVEQKAKVTEA
ncbi:MAG TPA: 50S ribosomal protein L32 [Spirochaetota bacterium]|nr:50S ribosomal protein L32 [Spirochaetota bacterium]